MGYKEFKKGDLLRMINTRNIKEITLSNLKNGEISLNELNELYNKTGFIFIGKQGKFTKIQKEIKH